MVEIKHVEKIDWRLRLPTKSRIQSGSHSQSTEVPHLFLKGEPYSPLISLFYANRLTANALILNRDTKLSMTRSGQFLKWPDHSDSLAEACLKSIWAALSLHLYLLYQEIKLFKTCDKLQGKGNAFEASALFISHPHIHKKLSLQKLKKLSQFIYKDKSQEEEKTSAFCFEILSVSKTICGFWKFLITI